MHNTRQRAVKAFKKDIFPYIDGFQAEKMGEEELEELKKEELEDSEEESEEESEDKFEKFIKNIEDESRGTMTCLQSILSFQHPVFW